tara:strand:- start:411 stop:983 length:573 start_codon:yes stop_codon:yes gene_type:complete
MIEIIHRVNQIDQLKRIDKKNGIEIDIRADNEKLVLAHDIYEDKVDFVEYINYYNHELLIANIKESGIEEKVIEQLDKNKILNFFLLDVEFPYILQNYEKYGNNLSLRFSKYEEIDTIKNFIGKVKWVWVDTYDDFNLDSEQANILRNFDLCLVSPSRWGHKNKIEHYINKFKKYDLLFEAIMIEESEAS